MTELAEALKRTALYNRHVALGARIVPFAGWEMPLRYTGDLEEVAAVRNAAGMFDVSHMCQVELRGADAASDANRLITNDISKAQTGQATYTMMCNEQGGVIDDLIVYKIADDHWFIVLNASRADVDMDWIKSHLSRATALEPFTPQRGIIALQGPKAESVLQPICEGDLSRLQRHFLGTFKVAGHECRLARTGYTGEDGFELFPRSEDLEEIWDSIIQPPNHQTTKPPTLVNPATHQPTNPPNVVKPCGLGARDVCRLEAGLRLYGNDLSEDISPIEAGLKWTVKLEKSDFIGKRALQEQAEKGAPRKTIGLKMLDRSIPRHDYPVLANGVEVGKVTSGIFSPTLKVGIAMALVKSAVAGDAKYEVLIRNEPHPAEVVKMPFVKK